MRIAHLLRKYDPAEWGGTETYLKHLLDSLGYFQVHSVVFCPSLKSSVNEQEDPLALSTGEIKRFKAFLPIVGITEEQNKELISVGGNLLSFSLPWLLAREKEIQLIHTHTMNRLGGVAATVARWRNLPLVVTIHGPLLDTSSTFNDRMEKLQAGGWDWGKVFGWLVGSRTVLQRADAILTLNEKESELLKQKFPNKRILYLPSAVPAKDFEKDQKSVTYEKFPQLKERAVLLIVGRIDPMKNQIWVVQQMQHILKTHPQAILVIAGSGTSSEYEEQLKMEIQRLGLKDSVLLTGGLAPHSRELKGLYQLASAVLVPSTYEPFGLVILEGWAAGSLVVSSRTSGALQKIIHGENGLLFDLEDPDTFRECIEKALTPSQQVRAMCVEGKKLVKMQFDTYIWGQKIKELYEVLIAEKQNKKSYFWHFS